MNYERKVHLICEAEDRSLTCIHFSPQQHMGAAPSELSSMVS